MRGQGKGWAPGEGAILPRGVPYEEWGAIILNNKMCGAAGGRWKAGFFFIIIIISFFGVGRIIWQPAWKARRRRGRRRSACDY